MLNSVNLDLRRSSRSESFLVWSNTILYFAMFPLWGPAWVLGFLGKVLMILPTMVAQNLIALKLERMSRELLHEAGVSLDDVFDKDKTGEVLGKLDSLKSKYITMRDTLDADDKTES